MPNIYRREQIFTGRGYTNLRSYNIYNNYGILCNINRTTFNNMRTLLGSRTTDEQLQGHQKLQKYGK